MQGKQEITNKVSFGLKKEERICSKKVIDKLFAEGESFFSYPLKIVFMKPEIHSDFPAQAGFAVSKRNFKRAVKRNRIKRLMREAYRTKKHLLYDELKEDRLAIFFVFMGKQLPTFAQIDKAMSKSIYNLIKRLQ